MRVPPELIERLEAIQSKITKSSDELNKRADFAENHDSETGQGLRTTPFAGAVVHKLVAEALWLDDRYDQQTPPSQHLVL